MSNKLRLITGNALDVLDRLIQEGTQVDMVYTSPNPPFYTKDNTDEENITEDNLGREDDFREYTKNLIAIFEKVRAILKRDGSLWFHSGDYSLYNQGRMKVPDRLALYIMDEYDWFLNSELIWYRPEPYKTRKRTRFKRDYESIFFFSKIPEPKIYNGAYLETSIITAPYIEPKKDEWNSGYPEKLISIPIQTCTKPGDIILDPFSGTGTTGKVALEMGRRYIGIDLFKWKTQKTFERLRAI